MLIDSDRVELSVPRGFLVLEGLNGAGKTSLQNKIALYLESRNFRVLKTREPGATGLGKALRELLLASEGVGIGNLAELFLFAADRAEHVEKIISPALKRGELVVSDRFLYSTLAFQGHGRGLDLSVVDEINRLAVSGLYPDIVILLDIDPELGLRRSSHRSLEIERRDCGDAFEKESLQFHKRVRRGFLDMARTRPEPFLVLDANCPEGEVFDRVLPVLHSWFEQVETCLKRFR